MSEQFKNDYHVYLYKYNYDKIKNKVQDLFKNADGTVYQYLFESFTTDLYSLGIPSDKVLSGVIDKKTYEHYISEYKNIVNKPNTQDKAQVNNTDTVTYTSLDNSNVSPRIVNSVDNILQQALAQNYALQMLQKDYEDSSMTSDAQTHWLNTRNQKQTYQAGIKKALAYSKILLDSIFKVIIDDLKSVQTGAETSEYVTCIDLTDLSSALVVEKPVNERTKNACDNFLNANTSTRLVSDDTKTDAVVSINSIQTSIDSITNMASITLRQDVLLKYNIMLEPNDIVEISSVNINKIPTNSDEKLEKTVLNKNTQFIGFITKLMTSSKYGQVQDINITCEGISKMLSLNPAVSSNAINPQFSDVINFVTGKEKTQDIANVNIYETFYSGKTVYDIYSDIVRDVLGAVPLNTETQNYTVHYISSPDQLLTMPYQYCKSLLVLYHMAVSLSTIRECGIGTDIVIAQLDCNIKQTYLEAYLTQLRSQYNLFWSTYIMPIQVLQSIISASFLEIFEDRSGVLIMRTPRYNTWYGNDVIEIPDMIEWRQSLSDTELKSRADYQWSIEYYGQMAQLDGGAYQNIPALLKYGFRADSPQSSPNAQSEILCAVFGALSVTKANGKTRELTVIAPARTDYKLGRLYYIPVQSLNSSIVSTGCVGYLTSIDTVISPGNVDQHTLTFTYVRNAELLKNPNSTVNYGYILNFTHLPDLEILLSKFDKSMISKAKDTSVATENGLVAYTNRYWAQFIRIYKRLFDAYVSGTITIGDIDESNYTKFNLAAAPTLLSKTHFQKYENIDNTSYQPSQQLINDIWYIDLLIRCGFNIDTEFKKSGPIVFDTKVLRAKEYEKQFLNLLNKDKTIKKVELPAELETKYKKTFVAHISNFLIKSSLKPSFLYAINIDRDAFNAFFVFINLFKDALDYISTIKSDSARVDYLNKYYEKQSLSKPSEFTFIIERQTKILKMYDLCGSNQYYFYNLFNKLDTPECKRDTEAMLKEYDKYVKSSKIITAIFKRWLSITTSSILNTGVDAINSPMELLKQINKLLDPYSIKSLYKSSASTIIPAVQILNDDVKDATHPPLLDYEDLGFYVTGVSPIDYTPFFKENVVPKIKAFMNADIKNGLKLFNSNALSLTSYQGEVLGTVTGLVIDTQLSSDLYIVCYPIVTFEKPGYAATYSVTEEALTAYIQTNPGARPKIRQPAAFIVLGPTKIPESKIPTIQQIAHQKGLYSDDKSINAISAKCIFDPSVICKWTLDELSEAFTFTIYNNVGDPCTSFSLINNYIPRLKYVYTTESNLSRLTDITLTHQTINDSINNLFVIDSTTNEYINIEKIEGTSKFRLQDKYIKNKSKVLYVLATHNTMQSLQIPSGTISQTTNVSVTSENLDYYSQDFATYVQNREDIIDNIYKSGNTYIKFQNNELYGAATARFTYINEQAAEWIIK